MPATGLLPVQPSKPIHLACPYCGARVGVRCESNTGRPCAAHTARLRALHETRAANYAKTGR